MANTLYASFADAGLAEKAAGALLDHGVRAEDLSLIQHESRYGMSSNVTDDTSIPSKYEGELTGATTDSPAVMGTGSYTENRTESYTEQGYTGADREPETRTFDAYDTETGSGTYAENRVVAEGTDLDEDDAENPVSYEKAAKHGISTTTGADAGSGAIKGGAVGLGVGAIAALASLLVPGIGLIVGGGALATAIGGLVATTGAGAAVGAVTGYLKDQGVEEHIAQQYGEAIEGGGAVLAVHVPSGEVDEPKARQLLEKYGATNVNTYAMADSSKPYMS